jgi:hypothetical protein
MCVGIRMHAYVYVCSLKQDETYAKQRFAMCMCVCMHVRMYARSSPLVTSVESYARGTHV